jgi:GT2 family glycosyltransferase
MEKFVSIIYVYFNTPIEIKQSINSVLKTSGIRFEIIIVNNNSPKPLPKNLKKSVKIITNLKNLGYGKAVNQGVRIAK